MTMAPFICSSRSSNGQTGGKQCKLTVGVDLHVIVNVQLIQLANE